MVDLSAEALLEYDEIVNSTFSSEDEGFDFYNRYALKKGFSIRKCYLERDSATNQINLRKLVCSRQGFREKKHMERAIKKRKPRNLTRCGCLAKMIIALNKETGQWYVREFIDEHDHPLAPPDIACLLRSQRGINDGQKHDIIEMETAGFRKHQIMDILEMQAGGYDKAGCIARDIYNFCYKYKQENISSGDAQTVISHLKARQNMDPDFFFKYLTDEKGHMKGLFWSDVQSRLDYEAFGDVIVFDSTYRTNRYNLPFVPFVGLNHHRSTVIFGCGIISHETTEAYEWLLRTFLAAMSQKHPISVITDGDLAMQSAIRNILPNSNHRLCTWHIERNIIQNLHKYEIAAEFRKFLYDCCTIEELERKWDSFIERNQVSDKNSWLHQMYQMRKLWYAAYQVGKCFLGLKSNQRSESSNSELHTHLDSRMTLFDMMRHYEHYLSKMRRNEAVHDCKTSQSTPYTELDAANIEKKDDAHVFTSAVFGLEKVNIDSVSDFIISEILDGCDLTTYIIAMKEKRDRKFEVACEFSEAAIKDICCSCHKLECDGIPCGHIFYVLKLLHEERLPKCCVASRWTMGAKAAFPPIRKSGMFDHSQSLERFRELRSLSHAACLKASQSDASYMHLKNVLNGMVVNNNEANNQNPHVSYSSILPKILQVESHSLDKILDPVHVKSRGAPKKNQRIKGFMDKPTKRTCSCCKKKGHDRRTCSKYKQLEKKL